MPLCCFILAVFGLQAKSTYTDIHSFPSKFKENNVFIIIEGTKISGTEHLTIQTGNDEASKIYINKGTFVSGAENIDADIIVIPVNLAIKQSTPLIRKKAKKEVIARTFKVEKPQKTNYNSVCYPKKDQSNPFLLSKISTDSIVNFTNSFQITAPLQPQFAINILLISKDEQKLTGEKIICIYNSYPPVHIVRPPPFIKKHNSK